MNRKQFLVMILALPIVGKLIAKGDNMKAPANSSTTKETLKLIFKREYYAPEILGLWGTRFNEYDLPPYAAEKYQRQYSKVKKIVGESCNQYGLHRLAVLIEEHEAFLPNRIVIDEKDNLYRILS